MSGKRKKRKKSKGISHRCASPNSQARAPNSQACAPNSWVRAPNSQASAPARRAPQTARQAPQTAGRAPQTASALQAECCSHDGSPRKGTTERSPREPLLLFKRFLGCLLFSHRLVVCQEVNCFDSFPLTLREIFFISKRSDILAF